MIYDAYLVGYWARRHNLTKQDVLDSEYDDLKVEIWADDGEQEFQDGYNAATEEIVSEQIDKLLASLNEANL